jgi:hypothetical protein
MALDGVRTTQVADPNANQTTTGPSTSTPSSSTSGSSSTAATQPSATTPEVDELVDDEPRADDRLHAFLDEPQLTVAPALASTGNTNTADLLRFADGGDRIVVAPRGGSQTRAFAVDTASTTPGVGGTPPPDVSPQRADQIRAYDQSIINRDRPWEEGDRD